jgi:hypothetical protein
VTRKKRIESLTIGHRQADLDSLGQLLLWCLAGQPLWQGRTLDELRGEKQRWRASGPVRHRRWGELLPPQFCEYFEAVEALQSTVERPDYARLAALFAPLAAKSFGPAALSGPEAAPVVVEEKENSSSPVLVAKKKRTVKKETATKPAAKKVTPKTPESYRPRSAPRPERTSPTRPATMVASPRSAPSLRTRLPRAAKVEPKK